MSDDLIAFLRARIGEDEAVARAVEDRSAPWEGRWMADGPDCLRTYNGHVLTYGHRTTDGRDLPIPLKAGLVEHWARHDPARVLREVEAKRGIVAQYESAREQVRHPVSAENRVRARVAQGELEDVLRLLALPYADHPDYEEACRP
jgi:hypothetical protein